MLLAMAAARPAGAGLPKRRLQNRSSAFCCGATSRSARRGVVGRMTATMQAVGFTIDPEKDPGGESHTCTSMRYCEIARQLAIAPSAVRQCSLMHLKN